MLKLRVLLTFILVLISNNFKTINYKLEIINQYQEDYLAKLEIPKINVKRGFLDVKSKYNNVDYNVTVINGSTMPDEDNNNLILASHSGYCSVCYFHDLYKIELNDIAIIYYKGAEFFEISE